MFNVDLDPEGLNQDDFVSVFELTSNKLKERGYEIPDSVHGTDGFLVVIP